MRIPFISEWIQQARDRANVAENQRLYKAKLKRKWDEVDRLHKIALVEHKAACERHHINPTPETYAATWRHYDRTWELFGEFMAIWRKLRGKE